MNLKKRNIEGIPYLWDVNSGRQFWMMMKAVIFTKSSRKSACWVAESFPAPKFKTAHIPADGDL